MRSRSLPVRRAMTVGVITALAFLGGSLLIVFATHGRDVDLNTHHTAKAVARTAALRGQGRLPSLLPKRGAEAIQVVNLRGQVVASTRQLAGKPPMASFRPGADDLLLIRDLCPPAGLDGCMTVVSLRYPWPEGERVIYAARPVVHVLGDLALVLSLAALSLLMTALLSALTFWRVRTDMAHVHGIVAELAEIASSGLGQRVTVPTTYEEITRLAESVNSTLDRLEAALEPVSHFAADLSHDLRSPITAIRVRLEAALMYPAETDWPRTGAKIMGDVEQLHAVVSDLTGAGRRGTFLPRPDRPR